MNRGAIIALILKYIGGKPLFPLIKLKAEGTPPVKQIPKLGMGGLTSLVSALGGASLSTLTSSIFQNPISSITSSTLNSITNIQSSLTTQLGGLVDQGQLSQLTSAFGDIGTATTNLQSLTNNISGVTLPNYDLPNTFGLGEVTGMLDGYSGIVSQVTSAQNQQFGITSLVNTQLTNLTAPLNFGSRLTEIGSSMETIKNDLISQAGQQGFENLLNSSLTSLQGYQNEINTLTQASETSMSRLETGLDISNSISQIQNSLQTGSSASKTLLNTVVQQSTLNTIIADIGQPTS